MYDWVNLELVRLDASRWPRLRKQDGWLHFALIFAMV